jgi:transcriptional regulator with XRE-family HTH domain
MPEQSLADRLAELRATWPGGRLTQPMLARALKVSVPLVSSWENGKATPSPARLDAYARFFARTPAGRPHLPVAQDLDAEERNRFDALLEDLLARRGTTTPAGPAAGDGGPANPLRYPPGQAITIVCSELPLDRRRNIPYADPADPDYVASYRYADLDALFELRPHVGKLNPASEITVGTWEELSADDKTAHLIALGGVDFNPVIRATLEDLNNLPVSQIGRPADRDTGGFRLRDRDDTTHDAFPELRDGRLISDVAHFLRAPNMFNAERTITFFGGQYSRGSYGVVRALTDSKLGERNAAYLRRRFGDAGTFSVVCRVQIKANEVVVPDWTIAENLLHEWPAAGQG